MQHVKPKWLHLYNYVLVGIDILMFVVFFAFKYLHVSQDTINHWGITEFVLLICGIHMTYVLLIYPFLRRKNEWIAHAISQAIMGVYWSVIIETSGTTNMVYRVGFGLFVFFLNLIGPYMTIAAVTLMWLILTFDTLSVIKGAPSGILYNVVIDTFLTAGAIAGYLLLRPYYMKDKATAELTNLLEQEQVKSSVVLESITDGVVVINVHGNIQIINQAAANMFGWVKNEALRMDYRSLYKPAEQPAKDVIGETLKSGRTQQTVVLLETHSHKHFYVDILASPIMGESYEEDGQTKTHMVGAIVVFRDVDKQKKEEQQRTEFISTASHEMRTPVAAIEGYLALAMNDKVCLIDEKARGYLQSAHASTQHLGQLFQDLLTSAKADDGRLASHLEVVEFNAFLEKLIEDLRFAAEKKGLALEYVLGTDQEHVAANTTATKLVKPFYYVEVDPDRVREVITNLFDNAVKYTASGKITIGLTANDDVVQFYIQDTGSGIPPDDVPHLFQKFYRVDNSATRTVGGTGLGLYICRKIIELYDGRIWVKSQLGKGSTFFVNLPRLDSARAEAEKLRLSKIAPPSKGASNSSPQQPPTVLQ